VFLKFLKFKSGNTKRDSNPIFSECKWHFPLPTFGAFPNVQEVPHICNTSESYTTSHKESKTSIHKFQVKKPTHAQAWVHQKTPHQLVNNARG
jgi:hypothetical protein